MGTLSKRRLEDFGVDVKSHVEQFRSSVGKKLDHLAEEVGQTTREGPITRGLGRLAAALPSAAWLAFAGLAAATSAALQLSRKKHGALFTGLWVPSFLLLGVYNKLAESAAAHTTD